MAEAEEETEVFTDERALERPLYVLEDGERELSRWILLPSLEPTLEPSPLSEA